MIVMPMIGRRSTMTSTCTTRTAHDMDMIVQCTPNQNLEQCLFAKIHGDDVHNNICIPGTFYVSSEMMQQSHLLRCICVNGTTGECWSTVLRAIQYCTASRTPVNYEYIVLLRHTSSCWGLNPNTMITSQEDCQIGMEPRWFVGCINFGTKVTTWTPLLYSLMYCRFYTTTVEDCIILCILRVVHYVLYCTTIWYFTFGMYFVQYRNLYGCWW